MDKKILFISAVAVLAGIQVKAQTKIGDNSATINTSSILELETTNKGLLLPRVLLTGTANVAPLGAHVQGMTVYNTATTGNVTPGFYYNDGTKWVRIAITGPAGNPVDTTNDAWVNATTSTRVELSATSTGTVRTAGSEFVVNDNGSVGIGVTSATTGKVAIQENGTFAQGLLITNSATNKANTVGISATAAPTITNNTAFTAIGSYALATPNIAAGSVNPGFAYGAVNVGARGVGGADGGTLNALWGNQIQYGHIAGSNSTTKTNFAYGLSVLPSANAGIIDKMYDVFIGGLPTNAGATINDHFSVYNFSDSRSYFRASIGINKENPGSKLAVVGLSVFTDNTQALAGTTTPTVQPALSNGDFYRTADGTVKVVF